MEFTILMPCLNEEKTVRECVTKALKFLKEAQIEGEVLVMDNGSGDQSVDCAKKAGARVMVCPQKGYGRVLRLGIRQAKGKYVIMGDCDCSYDFSALEAFVLKLRNGADMVIGNRFEFPMEKGAMSISHRYFGVPLLSYIGRWRYGTNVQDFHCGLRGIHKERFADLDCKADGMEFATEMIGKAALQEYKIEEVPVVLHRDKRGRKSHLRSIPDGFRHILVMIK